MLVLVGSGFVLVAGAFEPVAGVLEAAAVALVGITPATLELEVPLIGEALLGETVTVEPLATSVLKGTAGSVDVDRTTTVVDGIATLLMNVL